jgi:hypothetical protein
VYRLWRDGGFAVGALLAGILADVFDLTTAVWAVAGLTAASGVVVAIRMYETHPPQPKRPLPLPLTATPDGSPISRLVVEGTSFGRKSNRPREVGFATPLPSKEARNGRRHDG